MNGFTVIPAIDIKGGRCVRLRQGVASAETVFDDDPLAEARRWEAAGARLLHVVDLDGAFAGRPVHRELILKLVRQVSIPVQVGGGIRKRDEIREYLDGGVARVIIGTRAVEEPEIVRALAAEFREALIVGIDARSGKVAVRGWTESSGVSAADFAREVDAAGVARIIYTDISRDGMMAGVNVAAVDRVCEAVACRVVASGGVASSDDIAALRDLRRPNLEGVIVGRALYEGRIRLEDVTD